MTILERAEARRTLTLSALDEDGQSALGQYFTPIAAAEIIAALPQMPKSQVIRVLDPGAGSGMLSAALVQRIRAERPDADIYLTAVEIDEAPLEALRGTLMDLHESAGVEYDLVNRDFVEWSLSTGQRFDLVIQNPPYKKLPTNSETQAVLRGAGIEVPNIYAAFLELGVGLLDEGGQQVAITPRSWMNGTYYSTFRRGFVEACCIDSIHTFESRSKVFKDTKVLQEAIVVSATKGGRAEAVEVFTSHDHQSGVTSRTVPYSQVVTRDFIHVPATEKDAEAVEWMEKHAVRSLESLGLKVSTGRVVDFRAREMLHHDRSGELASPMVSPTHMRGGLVHHPLVSAKKPQWFETDPAVAAKLLVPGGVYVLIKRFSAKEERRRVVAAVWESDTPAAFDNKLNFVHIGGNGIDPTLARGLTTFLNSTRLDDYFRVFSGHTQVNATDLRQMRFPSLEQLEELAVAHGGTQDEIDTAVEQTMVKATMEVLA